jgi:hypothetical protein
MPRKRAKHDRLSIIFAKVNPLLRMLIEKQAESEGISLSDVVRRAVLRDLQPLERKSA